MAHTIPICMLFRFIFINKKWVLFYSNSQHSVDEIVQQLVAQIFQIPWGHNIHIISKAKNIDEALFYISKTIENVKFHFI